MSLNNNAVCACIGYYNVTGLTRPSSVAINHSTVTLAWKTPTEPNGVISRYNLYRNGTRICCENLEQRSTVDTGLQPYTLYAYTFTTETDSGAYVSNASDASIVRTVGDIPSTPLPPSVDQITHTSFRLSWTPPSPANGIILGYQLFLNETEVFLGDGFESSGDVLSFQGVDLIPYTTYTCSITAVSEFGISDPSTTLLVRTDPGIPSRLAPVAIIPDVTDTTSTFQVRVRSK